MSVAFESKTVEPQPGESYRQFVERAHYALRATLPDWEERNQAVWSAWEERNGEPLRERAQKYFAQHKFVPNVCYFSEHETLGRDGKPVRYSLNELADICEEHNSRADRHNYSALASKHTADGQVSESEEPKVVGYVGSSRLGMVGNENPQWAAFFDEHHKADAYSQSVLTDKQRRSVEVNRYRDGRRPYFDPVAVLGADSPRLPLPVARYSEDAAEVDRYSIMAPAMVSGTNSFIPSFGPNKKQHYSEGQQTMVSPEDIQAIVRAIQSTPEMQWVKQQMGGSQEAGGQGAVGGQQMAPQQQYGNMQRYEANSDDDLELVEKYNSLAEENAALAEKYSSLSDVNERNMKSLAEMQMAVAELEQRDADKGREMQIRDLYQQYPHFVEVDEELDRCLYSRGGEMTDDDFTSHLEAVEKYAKRSSPVTSMVPGGVVKQEKPDAQAAAAQAERVVERYQALADQGKFHSYEEVEAMVLQEISSGK